MHNVQLMFMFSGLKWIRRPLSRDAAARAINMTAWLRHCITTSNHSVIIG
jgi:hypothetical protein